MGFYNYALMTTESAARVAALYTSTSSSQAADSTTACTYVLQELASNINMGGVSACGAGSPVSVSAASVTGPDGLSASKVTVTYTTAQMIPIPGILAGKLTIRRAVTMKLRG